MRNCFLTVFIAIISLNSCQKETSRDFTEFVNPRIGSGGHGHVFVGANVPFGMVQLGPTSIPEQWDWCSGYHSSDSSVIGFSHTHLSGTGIGDLFDITIMPVTGNVKFGRGTSDNIESGQGSLADRTKEICVPGYYSVPLSRYGIIAEVTATERAGFHRYTFPKNENSGFVIDLKNGGCWDKATKTDIEIIDSCSFKGFRFSEGWAKDQKIFFYAVTSKPFKVSHKDSLFARLSFETSEREQVMMKVGISYVSEEGAKLNLDTEIPSFDFEKCVKSAKDKWNEALSEIKIKTSDASKRTIFYTAMYHSMFFPSLFNDVNKDYRGADGKIHRGNNFDTYSVFSCWDTYRAEMPLLSIIQREKMPDIINTMLNIHKEQGKLPVWHLAGNETDCMVGNPGAIIVADAIVKNIDKIDRNEAFSAVKQSNLIQDRGQNFRTKYGYIPCDKMQESVAFDMEYAIADAAAGNAAKVLGRDEDASFFEKRSKSYKNYFDKKTLFMRGKDSDGKFSEPFNPYYSNHREDVYCEGNAWQYTWLVPHDFEGLVSLYGSREKLAERLDSLFEARSDIEGENASPDVSGLIGQYAHGNEPSHHIIYFYTMAGLPWKTADKVKEVLNTMYVTTDNGLPGNEDAGQMSAWYILSSMGFYQAEPASTRFWFGIPAFDETVINANGTGFTIKTINNDSNNPYIQSIRLDGKPYRLPYLEYGDIMKGGTLEITLGKDKIKWYD